MALSWCQYCFQLMDGYNTPSTHQFHGVFPKCTGVLESGGCSWEIQEVGVNSWVSYLHILELFAHFMGELFIKTIEEVGVDSCVQIITDNAPVCKDTGMIVETKYL